MNFCSVREASSLFCDAAVLTTDGRLAFASLWGRDTSVQGVLGALTLHETEGGLRRLHLDRTDTQQTLPDCFIDGGLWVPEPDTMKKLTGRITRTTQVHGSLVHAFIYHPYVTGTARIAIVMDREDGPSLEDQVWQSVKSLSSVPLIDAWRAPAMDLLKEQGFIVPLPCFGIRAVQVDLTDDIPLAMWLTASLKAHRIPVPKAA